jgi:hypothetical protein
MGPQQRQRQAAAASNHVVGNTSERIPVGNAVVVHATIESRHVSPGRKWVQANQDGFDETYSTTSRPTNVDAKGHFLSSSSATIPRRTKAGPAGGRDLLARPVNGGGRSYDALISSSDRSDMARENKAGSDVTKSIKPAVPSHFNHARLVGDELVIFNGID